MRPPPPTTALPQVGQIRVWTAFAIDATLLAMTKRVAVYREAEALARRLKGFRRQDYEG